LGFHVSIVYSICAEVNPLNLKLLEQVKEFFGGAGSISKSGNMYFYSSRTTSQTINILVWGRLFTFTLATLGKPKAEGPQPP
jgi:hypothetical protein